MAIDHKRFPRVLGRCSELASQTGTPSIVKQVYNDKLKDASDTYITTNAALRTATGSVAKEGTEAAKALKAVDQPYRVARSTVMAYLPHVVVPETLKALGTDTDKMDAIETLLDVLDENNTAKWAADLLAGEFGSTGAHAVKELSEAIDANKAFAAARTARMQAYGPAYEQYTAFKRVVRDACGPSSVEYRRIHLRSAAGDPEDPAPPAPPEPPTPPTP